MSRLRTVLAFSTLVLAVACGTNAPSSLAPSAPSLGSTLQTASPQVSWDPLQLGRVTVTNAEPSPLTLSFALWKYVSDDNQTLLAIATYTIPSGSTQVLTVGATVPCGFRVQRDLYRGAFGKGTTLSDVRNFLYAAPGALWPATPCDFVPPTPPVIPPPVVPPPVKVCEDRKANNYDKPLPCTYDPPCPPPTHGYGASTVQVPPCPVVPPCKPSYGTSTHTKPKPCPQK